MPTLAPTADNPALLTVDHLEDTPPTPRPAPTLPTVTPFPSATATTPPPTSSATPAMLPTATPNPAREINGVPAADIAVIPPETVEHVREIAARGQELGRNPRAFSKLGDSGVLVESNLTRFDGTRTVLGRYDYLQPTIDHFTGSWSRYGTAARVSLTAVGALDPMWANPAHCTGGESPVSCEIRLHNPAILLIRLGTNDGSAEVYERFMREIIEYAIENGVIPVLGTKADRFEGDDSINEATRRLAGEYHIPLWDFDALAGTLPNRGLSDDGAHLSMTTRNDYTNDETFQRGYPMSDLSTLFVLDALRLLLPAAE